MDSAEMEEDRAFLWHTITSNDGGMEWLCNIADEDPTYQEVVKVLHHRTIINPLRVLDLLHVPHASQVNTKKATQQLYYWPRMNAAILVRIAGCEVCTETLPSR